MFWTPLRSSSERLLAFDWKTMRLPSSEIAGRRESSLPPGPPAPGVLLTSRVVLATRSRTKMFANAGFAAGDRLSASDSKTT